LEKAQDREAALGKKFGFSSVGIKSEFSFSEVLE
jgi:hypothetical protein